MSVESEEDLNGLKRAGGVVAETIQRMRAAVAPGISTAELAEIASKVLEERGARSAPMLAYDFPGAVCISVNEQAVHGIPGPRRLDPGDLVTLDVTLELDGYYADAAVTVGVPPVSDTARRLIACAEAAFARGVRMARAGERLARVGGAVETEVHRHGFRVMCELCGHGIGRQIHEEPSVVNFYDPSDPTRLTRGLVIALEPIVSAGSGHIREDADGWTISSADGSLTAHYEHTLVITGGYPLVLTGN